MRFTYLLPLAGAAAAFVLPDPELFSTAAERAVSGRLKAGHSAVNLLDTALEAPGSFICCHQLSGAYRMPNFNEQEQDSEQDLEQMSEQDLERISEQDLLSDDASTYDRPHVRHGHKRSNLTVYQLISESKYTTKLAALIAEHDDLIKALNDTSANATLFAPTDKAFEKIPNHGHKPSKEYIKSLLKHHISGDLYPASRVLKSYTIPTLLEEEKLGGLQRLGVKLGLKGLFINSYSKVVAIDIFGTNGVIHAVDSVLFCPPPILSIIEVVPSAFSTLALGLTKTKLFKDLKATPHTGGTFFAPSNRAFAKLGPKVNAFLFSKYGNKYLRALLQYHVVYNATLYSNAYYHTDEATVHIANGKDGHYHLDLPTQLEDKSLPVDIARWGPFISIKVNGYVKVIYSDITAQDGVVQVVGDVLIPPKKLSNAEGDASYWDTVSELAVADLIERLEPYVSASEAVYQNDEDLHEESLPTSKFEHETESIKAHFPQWNEFL